MPRCEAMIGTIKSQFVQCGTANAQLHHKLTRARGGLILDKVGEDYHHLWLCAQHHTFVHGDSHAYDNGTMLRGYVVTGPSGRPVYRGPDEYLSKRYQ